MTKNKENFGYCLSGYMKANLDIILQEAIPNNWDSVIILHGKEGVGKSTLAFQMAGYIDKNFDIPNIVFTPDQFLEAVNTLPVGSAIVWDEAITAANAAMWASKISQIIVTRLTMIRKKKYKILICFPYLHMLNKYFVYRCRASIFVYSKGFTNRGHYLFYNQEQTEFVYGIIKEKYKFQQHKAFFSSKHAFYERFTRHMYVDENAYNEKKDSATKFQMDVKDGWKEMACNCIEMVRQHPQGISIIDLAKKLKKTKQYLYQLGKESDLHD